MPQVQIDTARPHRLWPIVLEKAKALLEHRCDVLLLVPEQFSASAESEILKGLGINGSLFLEVCTPSRLYQRYVRLGDVTAAPLEETGFHMAVAQALEAVREQLKYYRYSSYDVGFLQQLCSLITDMRHASLSPAILMQYASEADDPTTKAKFHDLARIFDHYIKVMNGRFSDGEDRLVFLGNLLLKTKALTHQHVIVFGFDTLTRQMMSLLTAIAKLSRSLDIVLCSDYQSANDGCLFEPVSNSIFTFLSMLQAEGVYAISEHHHSELDTSDAMFRALDHRLFNTHNRYTPYVSETDESLPLLTKQAASPLEEAKWIAHHIRALIDCGTNPSDICVMYPKNPLYDALIPLSLAEYGIPCFANPKLHMRNHRLPQFLVSALRCMADGWNRDDVLDVLHSGYCSLTTSEAAAFERYITTYNINHNRFLRPFVRGKTPEEIAAAEALRQKWLTPLLACREAIVNAATGTASVKAVYRLLQDCDVQATYLETLQKMCTYGLHERYRQEQPIWECLLRVLEQMALVAADHRIPLKHIAFRLQSGLDAISMAILPYGSNHVQAGYIGHMIQLKADYVFLCGLNDSALMTESSSLIAREKKAFEGYCECALGQTDRSIMTEKLLALKSAMLLPKKRLCISYCSSNEKGEFQLPLRCLNEALDALLPIENRMKAAPEKLPVSLPDIISRARTGGNGELLAEEALALSGEEKDFIRHALQPPHRESAPHISGATANQLYRTQNLSVSQLERYHSCPYQYFLHYGLRPQQSEQWRISDAETGTFYHNAIHRFSERLRLAAPETLSDDSVLQLTQEVMLPLAEQLLAGPYGDDAYSQAKWREAQQGVCDSAQMIWKQLANGGFQIWKTECSFGYPGGMPPIVLMMEDGRQVLLRGRIDRIDRYQIENETLLSVVDYKSSDKRLEASKTWAGLQLQLLLYLTACLQSQPEAKPAGAFYFWVRPMSEKSDNDLQETAEKAIRKAFRLKGFALADVVAEEVHDAKQLSAEHFERMLKHVRGCAVDICRHLLNGDIAPTPYQTGDNLPCRYCDYVRSCRFSPKAEAKKIRTLPSLTFQDMIDLLSQSTDETQTP